MTNPSRTHTHLWILFDDISPFTNITFWLILSSCLFCELISLPISTAMFLRLPNILLTSPIFCSISSSRASFVILKHIIHGCFLFSVWHQKHYLLVDSVELSVLWAYFIAHIYCHVSQIAQHIAHFAHILFHLIFPSIICYSETCNSLLIFILLFLHQWIFFLHFSQKAEYLNPYKPGSLLLVSLLSQRLISVFTVCLQEFLFEIL